jgi:hypothetical protein
MTDLGQIEAEVKQAVRAAQRPAEGRLRLGCPDPEAPATTGAGPLIPP